MQRKIFLIAALIAGLLTTFSHNLQAQTAKKQPPVTTPEERDKREVKKFVRSFIESLEDTKNLNQVPERFFAADFKTRFIEDCDVSDVETAVFNELSENERYEFNSTSFNSAYMGLMHAVGKFNPENSDETDTESSEDNDIESIQNLLPAEIFLSIKNSKTLNSYILEPKDEDGDKIDFEIEDIETLREFAADLKNLTSGQRIFLNERSPEQKAKYDKIVKEIRKEGNSYLAETCLKHCEGFPEKTQIFEISYFPVEVKMVRENGELKIFDLRFRVMD